MCKWPACDCMEPPLGQNLSTFPGTGPMGRSWPGGEVAPGAGGWAVRASFHGKAAICWPGAAADACVMWRRPAADAPWLILPTLGRMTHEFAVALVLELYPKTSVYNKCRVDSCTSINCPMVLLLKRSGRLHSWSSKRPSLLPSAEGLIVLEPASKHVPAPVSGRILVAAEHLISNASSCCYCSCRCCRILFLLHTRTTSANIIKTAMLGRTA